MSATAHPRRRGVVMAKAASPAPPTPPARYVPPLTAAALDRLERETWKLAIPPPRLNVSDWLDEHRVLQRGYPSAFIGPWRTERTPYLREPLDSFSDPAVESLVLFFGSQIGKTEAILGMLLYSYGVDPGPGMLVLPHLELAGDVSKDRLAPALDSCEGLVVGSTGARATDNAILHKRINRLPLTIAGANSAASLASRPVQNLFCDEIDKFVSSTEHGDPLALAEQRTASFRRRKKVYSSTPGVKGASRIEDLWERSDQRRLYAPCPRCGELFEVRWHHVRWDSGQPETAHLEHADWEEGPQGPRQVAGCGGWIEDHERKAMFAAAEWSPTAPFRGIRGYWTWAVVSPWTPLSDIVRQFLVKKSDPERLKQFVNEILAESWEVPTEKIETEGLLTRRENYTVDQLPEGVRIITAGVDTQDDRLEAVVMGWGTGEESWVLDHEILIGDPVDPRVWAELDLLLNRDWNAKAGGSMRIECALVDALGHKTAAVYAAVVARQRRRLYASFGRDGGDKGQLVTQPKPLATPQGNVMRCIVDASQAKNIIYGRLRLPAIAGPGVAHFPDSVGESFFESLTAEELRIERNKYGVPSNHWALRPGHKRNEVLDCTGLALAALRIICPTPLRFEEMAGRVAAAMAQGSRGPGASGAPPKGEPPTPSAPRTRRWSGGMGRLGGGGGGKW